jgi:hypothetical protein
MNDIMNRDTGDEAEPAAAEEREPAGKPQSQIDAEAPLEGEAADAAAAEYASRVPGEDELAGEPATEPGEDGLTERERAEREPAE